MTGEVRPVPEPRDRRPRIAIDLGAQSCRVTLLRWAGDRPTLRLVRRIPNGPRAVPGVLRWPFAAIFAGLEQGIREAAAAAPEGIASIAVDGWAVDYVRLGADGLPMEEPCCYRDERTVAAKERVDREIDPAWMFEHTGAQPLRINTLYQLCADRDAGVNVRAPWVNLPEYVLYRLGGRRVAEFTNATHTGLVDLAAGDWSRELIERLRLDPEAFPPIVPPGTVVGMVAGPLTELPGLRATRLIAPACHDTASAIAGIGAPLDHTAYICSGTWSLVGTLSERAIVSEPAARAGFTNQGAAAGGYCFHTNVNGLWMVQQCMETWSRKGRSWTIEDLVAQAERCASSAGIINVDAPELLLAGDMPAMVNRELERNGYAAIEDCAGNEPLVARVLFESLARRYADTLQKLEHVTGTAIGKVHILGGGSRNPLLTRLTASACGRPVEIGNVEGSTIGNFAVQLACEEAEAQQQRQSLICAWASLLGDALDSGQSSSEAALPA